MQRLNTPIMRRLLKKGIRLAKKQARVRNTSYFIPLFYHDTKNGWHYQIEKMFEGVMVYAFKPPRVFHAKSAKYFLEER